MDYEDNDMLPTIQLALKDRRWAEWVWSESVISVADVMRLAKSCVRYGKIEESD
jgi:hypothetical protein